MPPPIRPEHRAFLPPTPEQVRKHLERYPARRPFGLLANMPVVVVSVVLALVMRLMLYQGSPDPGSFLLAWTVLACIGLMIWHWRRNRNLIAMAVRAQDLLIQREWKQSLRLAWQALPPLANTPELHGRIVAVIAHNLDQLKAYDAAIIAYDHVIERLPPNHPGSIQFRIQRALAELANDHLTDADQTLRRLQNQVEPYKGTPTGAAYRLAVLTQQVRTNHYADATESEATLLDDLRPLGPDAGLGYGLMALAYARLAKSPEADPNLFQQAQVWWSRATHLLPTGVLTDRLPDLEFMTRLPSPPTDNPSASN